MGVSMKTNALWNVPHVALWKLTNVSDIFIALIMEAVSISETSVISYETTRRNILEYYYLNTLCHASNVVVEWLTLLFRIWQITDSTLDSETGYPD
jgi:hypothetical protein